MPRTTLSDTEILDYLEQSAASSKDWRDCQIGSVTFTLLPASRTTATLREVMSDAVLRHKASVADRVAKALKP